MVESKSKELVVSPRVSKPALASFLQKLEGTVNWVYADPKSIPKGKFKTVFESEDADMVVCKTIDQVKKFRAEDRTAGYFKKVLGNEDVDEIERASKAGAEFVIVDAADWKIIPLENIIAKLHKSKTRVFTTAKSAKEVRTMFAILELGVDGVILSTDSEKEVQEARQQLDTPTFPIKPAKILEIKDVGKGERVCVDTVSMLSMGEGMLIGSKSNFMLLVHNESVGSSFTSPRPFRVNAGSVYCYTFGSDGKTRYLSEIESGTEVLIVNKNGASRPAVTGRAKIETRPLTLIKAEIEGETGTVILQNAETIRLMTKDGKLISVTEVKQGDEVLGWAKKASGRHFGMEVDEYIVEK